MFFQGAAEELTALCNFLRVNFAGPQSLKRLWKHEFQNPFGALFPRSFKQFFSPAGYAFGAFFFPGSSRKTSKAA